jgi:Flp pilus assembly protein TadD
MDSSFAEAHWMLALTYEQQAMYEQSLAELRRLQELAASDSLDVNATLAHLLAATGKSKEARKLLAELQTPVQQRYVSPYNLAVIYHALGDNEQSFALLERHTANDL